MEKQDTNNDIRDYYLAYGDLSNEMKKLGNNILNSNIDNSSYKELSKNIIEEYNNIKNINKIYKRIIIFYNIIVFLLVLIILFASII